MKRKEEPDEKIRDISESLAEKDDVEYPKMRPVEAIPANVRGQKVYFLHDPSGISQKIVMLQPPAFYIISLFDGNHSIRDIQVLYNRKFGQLIFSDQIRDIIFEMDTALLLDNRRFRQYVEFLKQEFKKSEKRECILCGQGYPGDPEKLKEEIGGYFKSLPEDNLKKAPVGIVSPHIDFGRGGPTYAAAYQQLQKSDKDIFVIFATSHRLVENFIALTDKTFSTPIGDLPTHSEFVKNLAEAADTDYFADELLHRDEHSIEMQAVMLRYIFPEKNIKIVPILVGSLDDLQKSGGDPARDPRVVEFERAFKKTVNDGDYNCSFIAGVDFSHVGTFFGDLRPVTRGEIEQLEQWELENLKLLEKSDADGFFENVIRQQDEKRVCGLSPLYLMMKAMNPSRGKLLRYCCCSDDTLSNNVGIAAMSFYND